MRRWLPSPPLTLMVIVFWPLMVHQATPQQLVLAVILGLVIPLFAARIDREFARIGDLRPLPKLVLVLIWDIILCNIEVARRVLGPERNIHPGFIWYPLELGNIHGISVLSGLITVTPGTVTASLSEDRKYLLIHVFNLDDPAQLIADIKRRYEMPLKEIFP